MSTSSTNFSLFAVTCSLNFEIVSSVFFDMVSNFLIFSSIINFSASIDCKVLVLNCSIKIVTSSINLFFVSFKLLILLSIASILLSKDTLVLCFKLLKISTASAFKCSIFSSIFIFSKLKEFKILVYVTKMCPGSILMLISRWNGLQVTIQIKKIKKRRWL